MTASRFFEWFQFGAVVGWGVIGLTRAFLFHPRGVPIMVIDRQRTALQKEADLLAAACLLVWFYEIIAYAWRFDFHIGPVAWHRIVVDNIIIKTVGALVGFFGLLLYALALQRLGSSWRLGIDRTTPGPLVTEGIYRFARHPIYLAFDLLFVGAFPVLGRAIFLVLALVWIPLMHSFMLREEHFLTEKYHGAYRDYCRRVGRYFSWRRFGPESNAV